MIKTNDLNDQNEQYLVWDQVDGKYSQNNDRYLYWQIVDMVLHEHDLLNRVGSMNRVHRLFDEQGNPIEMDLVLVKLRILLMFYPIDLNEQLMFVYKPKFWIFFIN